MAPPDRSRGRLPSQAYFEAALLGVHVVNGVTSLLFLILALALFVVSRKSASWLVLECFYFACIASVVIGVGLGGLVGGRSIRRARPAVHAGRPGAIDEPPTPGGGPADA